jgi:hypothetical protein
VDESAIPEQEESFDDKDFGDKVIKVEDRLLKNNLTFKSVQDQTLQELSDKL